MAEASASAGAAPSKGKATVQYNVYNQVGDFGGMTVGEVRAKFAPQWGIEGDAQAYNGKTKLTDDTVIEPGWKVEFHRRSGEKG